MTFIHHYKTLNFFVLFLCWCLSVNVFIRRWFGFKFLL